MVGGWKTYKLSEAFNIIGGGTPKTSIDEYWNGDIPWLSVVDFNNDQRTVNTTEKTISELGLEKSSTKLLKKGQLIISARGTVGQLAQLGYDMTFNQSCYGLNGIQNILENDFGYYLLKHSVANIQSNAHGSVFDTITRNTFDNIEIPIPEITEQKAIASILSALDDKIELNLQQNKTLAEMAMALYKHWFVDFGPFKDGKFIESELGLIPEGWEVKTVGEFGIVKTGKTPSKKYPDHFGEDVSFVTPSDFKNYGKHITQSLRGISNKGADKHKNSLIPENSVIVTCIGSDMGKVSVSKVKCLTNQQINSLITDEYLFMYCFFIYNYDLLRMLAGDGTTMPIINKSSFERIKVIYPTTSVFDEFNKGVKFWDEQMHVNTLENQTLTTLRDTLLPKLISGEVRVKDIEQEISKVL